MSDLITLTTSDTPPISLTIRRSSLVANSTVFDDLLSLPTSSEYGSAEASLAVTETEKELKPFLNVIGGEEDIQLDEIGWESLAKLGDKYDSSAVRREVKARILYVSSRSLDPSQLILPPLGKGTRTQEFRPSSCFHPGDPSR
jgi:hypothetical protein